MTRCILLIGVLCMFTGCGDKTKGLSSGRVGIHDSTAAEVNSGKILIGDLASASSVIAQSFISDLNRLAEEDWGGYRVTLIVGDINNETSCRARVSTSEFEYVQSKILSKLTDSKSFRNNVKITRKNSRIEQLKNREKMNSGSLLDSDSPGNQLERADDEYVYFLNSDMYTINRGSTSLYYLRFTLDNARDGEIVFSEDYEVKYK